MRPHFLVATLLLLSSCGSDSDSGGGGGDSSGASSSTKPKACTTDNGSGQKVWNKTTKKHSETCTITACDAGYDNVVDKTQCQQTAADYYSLAKDKTRKQCSTTIPDHSLKNTVTGSALETDCWNCKEGSLKKTSNKTCMLPGKGKYYDVQGTQQSCRGVDGSPSGGFDRWENNTTPVPSDDKCKFSCKSGFTKSDSLFSCNKSRACRVNNGGGLNLWDTNTDKFSTTCTLETCNAGYDNTQDPTQCQRTAARFYSPANNNARIACPTPSNSSPTTTTGLFSTVGCFTCGGGYDNTKDATQCQRTAANFYSPANNNAQIACPTPSSSTPTSTTGLSSADGCFTCDDAGYDNTQDPTKCQQTAASFYSPANNNAQIACPTPSSSTPTSTTGLSSADGCFTCDDAGYDNTQDPTKCQQTAANFYSPANNNARIACSTPNNSSPTTTTGGPSADACFTCGGGYDNTQDPTKCQQTAANFYSPANNNARIACSTPNNSSPTTTTGLFSTVGCFTCGGGYDNTKDATQCQRTAAKFYSPANNNAQIACPTPSSSTPTSTTGLSSADGCFTCDDAGYDNTQDPTKCQQTAANFYSPANNNARIACSTPSSSTPTATTGLSSAGGCFTCNDAGYDNTQDPTKCQQTAANFYSPANNNARIACSTPNNSSPTTTTGGPSADACFTCGGGYDNTQDPTKCQQTAANFYSPANNNARIACSTPSSSTPTATTGLSSADACFTCGGGYDNTQDPTKCQQTAANFYSPANNNARTACPTPSNSSPTTTTGGPSADACFTCGGGYDNTQDPTKCQQTAANFYSPANNNARIACSTPSSSTPTATTGLSSAGGCFTCNDAGYDNTQDPTKCQQTAANFYSPANNNARTACPTPSNSSPTTTTGRSSVEGCFTCSDDSYFPKASTCEKIEPDAFALGDKTSYVLYNSGEVEGWGKVDSDPWVFNRKIDLGTVNGTKNKAQAIESGTFNHRCVILKNGTNDHGAVKCWGENDEKQLGVGGRNDRDTPTDVTAMGNDTSNNPYTAKSLALGEEHTCAILNDDKVKCWGSNNFGQIGGGSGSKVTVSGTKGDPLGGGTATAIAAYHHTCALLPAGSVKCWGKNIYETTAGGVPSLGNGRTATAVTAGGAYSCALKDDQTIGCWGWNGKSTRNNLGAQVFVQGDFFPFSDAVTRITTGSSSLCTILADKTVKCWDTSGFRHYGEIGGAETDPSTNLVVVRGTSGDPLESETAVSLAMGKDHTCALTEADKSIKCFGKNDEGQIIGTLNMEGGTDGTGTSTGVTGTLTADSAPSASALETDANGKICGFEMTDGTNSAFLQYATPKTYNTSGNTDITHAIDNLIAAVNPVRLGGSNITLTRHADNDKIVATVDIPIFDGMTLNIAHDDDGENCSSPVATQILLSGSTTAGATAKGLWVISDDYTYSIGADKLINFDGVEIDLGTSTLTNENIANAVITKIKGASGDGLQYTHLPYSAAKIDGAASTTDDCPSGNFCVEFTRIFAGSAGNNGIPFGDADYEQL